MAAVAVTALLAASASGCGGGNGKDPIPTTCISFEAAAAPAGSTVVARQGTGSTCEMVQIELVLTGVTDVQSVEFRADFDGSVARYEGLSLTGSTLISGVPNPIVFEDEDPGQVSISLSRLNTGIDFVPDGTVVLLIFSKATNTDGATGGISFSDTLIFDSAAPPQLKNGIQWHGGTFRIAE
jgi:hypothetical protein